MRRSPFLSDLSVRAGTALLLGLLGASAHAREGSGSADAPASIEAVIQEALDAEAPDEGAAIDDAPADAVDAAPAPPPPSAHVPGGPYDLRALERALPRPGYAVEPAPPRRAPLAVPAPVAPARVEDSPLLRNTSDVAASATARPVRSLAGPSGVPILGDAPLLSVRGALQPQDRLTFSGLRANGRTGTGLDWNVPLDDGAHASLTVRRDATRIAQLPTSTLDINGETQVTSLQWRRPLVQGSASQAEVFAGWRAQDDSRWGEGTRLWSGERRDATLGVDLRGGEPMANWSANAVRVAGSVGSGTDMQDFGVWRGGLRMNRRFGDEAGVALRLNGQLGPTAGLPGGAGFGAGGDGSVRGYRPGYLYGGSGYSGAVEWNQRLALSEGSHTRVDGTFFVDHGAVRSFDGSTFERITGVGAGLWFRNGRDLSVRLTVAQPLEIRPGEPNRPWVNMQIAVTPR